MARKKHKPQRTCIVCKTVNNKRDLIRIVRTPEQDVIVDLTGKANGRGVYLCSQPECWEKGLKKERIGHALKINLSSEDINALMAVLQNELSKG